MFFCVKGQFIAPCGGLRVFDCASGASGLPAFTRRLLSGYAASYNRRHRRSGHLFQNRYKSILCEEDPYFKELVR